MQEQLERKFAELYGESAEPARVFFAPGRVNLIGEHTDYNGGYVFPAALSLGTAMIIRKRADRRIRLASLNFEAAVELEDADSIQYDAQHDWANYPKAVLFHLQKRGYRFGGYDVLFGGNLPNGAGLSSSASIEVVTGYGFLRMEGAEPDPVQLAQICQEAENQFIGVNCGIMDQFAVAVGRKDHAILLQCSTLKHDLVPFRAAGHKLVIGNTNKRRGLADSEYNRRRAQCEEAVRSLHGRYPTLELLAELDAASFESAAESIADDVVRKRARHVVEENARVLASVEALKRDDLVRFGRLMIQSHASLRDLYEVSCRELDVMVEAALNVDGVLGSRMTGAGFGGCTVSLVRDEAVERFVREVGSTYRQETGLEPEFIVAEIGDGAREITA